RGSIMDVGGFRVVSGGRGRGLHIREPKIVWEG
ncbi:MAG: hypothetical protein QOH78_1015, partial [Verrucomicrobiota bacterium]